MTDERILISRAQRGETDAFNELVRRSRLNVYRLALGLTGNRHDAEDLSQDVFVKAYQSIGKFRGESKWDTWLYRITVNVCNDHRKLNRRTMVEYSEDERGTTAEREDRPAFTAPERAAEAGMIQAHIAKAMDALSPSERSVFVLRHYHDLPLKQIAQALDVAEGTVKSHLFRALQRLQRELAFYRGELGLEEML